MKENNVGLLSQISCDFCFNVLDHSFDCFKMSPILYWQTKGIGQTESVDSDPCKWAVWFRKRGGAEIYLLKASSPETKELWIKTIKECHDKKKTGLLKGLLESLVCVKLNDTLNHDFTVAVKLSPEKSQSQSL